MPKQGAPASRSKPKPKAKALAKRAKPATSKRAKPATWAANAAYDRAIGLLHDDPVTAVKQFKAAAKVQPTRARIHINLSWALSKLGQHAEAKMAALRAHELDPHDAYVAARRVHVLFEADDNAVIEAARHTMQLPDIPAEDRLYAHSAICWTLMRTAPAAAVRETEELVATWPDDGQALAARGCALAAVCRWNEGVSWLDQAIAAAPEDTRFALRRAQIIEARDVAEALLAKLRAGADRHPTEAKPWRELGLGLAKFARLEEALDAFARARELAPGHGTRHDPLVTAALMVEATARSYVLVGNITPIG